MKKVSFNILILILVSVQYSNGQIRTSEVSVDSTNNVTSINGNLGIGTDDPNIYFVRPSRVVEVKHDSPVIKLNSSNKFNAIVFCNTTAPANHTGEFTISHEFYVDSANTSVLAFYSYDPQEHYSLALTSNGRVGIGLVNPSEKLHVNGKIRTAQNTWPDFVFNKNYKLPTLMEVEEQIKRVGHLSGIPSEEEVVKDGYVLGDMDARLLQKIEELTLYMIDLNKQVQQLKVENELLKSKIED